MMRTRRNSINAADDDSFITHCLQFSDEWFAVNRLSNPRIQHSLTMEVYQKYEDQHGTPMWKNLMSNSGPLDVGTSNSNCSNDNVRISYHQHHHDDESSNITDNNDDGALLKMALDCNTQRLLIPDIIQDDYEDNNMQMKQQEQNVVDEFLIVPKTLISVDGKECNVAGVGYEAFVNNPKRCSSSNHHQPKNDSSSCLANQPRHFIEHDRINKNKGKYFLKYHAKPVPLLSSTPRQQQHLNRFSTLKLYHTQPFTVLLDLDVKLAYNVALLHPHSSAIITKVYIDSTINPHQTIVVTAKVTNFDVQPRIFYVTLNGCSLNVPASFNNIASKPVLIEPQLQHIYKLNIEYAAAAAAATSSDTASSSNNKNKNSFVCFLNVVDGGDGKGAGGNNHAARASSGELIAMRQIRFQKFDQCVCIWHCECVCFDGISSSASLVDDDDVDASTIINRCVKVMSLESYHAAGFLGALPRITTTGANIQLSEFEQVLVTLFRLSMFLTFALLAIGLLKAVLGLMCCCNAVGVWGLDVILDVSKSQLLLHRDRDQDENVKCKRQRRQRKIYDTSTSSSSRRRKRHHQRYITRNVQFSLNIVFFFIYPLAVFNLLFWRLCVESSSTNENVCPSRAAASADDDDDVKLLRDIKKYPPCGMDPDDDDDDASSSSSLNEMDLVYINYDDG